MAKTYTDFRTKDICWTTTPYSIKALQQIPYIEMVGYQQLWSALIEGINTWKTRFNPGINANPYANLYAGEETNTYILPYLNEYHHNISQRWEENNGPIGDTIKDLSSKVENFAKTVYPAAGILFPQSYAGSDPASFTFTFNLINTNASDGSISNNIVKNKNFLEQFIRDNLHDQNGMLSVSPPLIYEIYIPGIRWSPAAIVSSLTVNNKGTMNKGIVDKQNYIYPDAWEVTVGIRELINESRIIWDDAIKGATGSDKIITTKSIEGVTKDDSRYKMIKKGEKIIQDVTDTTYQVAAGTIDLAKQAAKGVKNIIGK